MTPAGRRTAGACLAAAVALAGACADRPPRASGNDRMPRAPGMEEAERIVGPRPTTAGTDSAAREPALYVDGRPATRSDVWARLAEVAGAAVVEEIILERRLEAACREAGFIVTEADIEREHDLFVEALADTGVSPDPQTAASLLARVRDSRGLGDVRFAALLRRSAMLRRLVADQVLVSDDAARLAWELRWGERSVVRLITLPTPRDAQRAMARLDAGEAFASVASELSTDISAARGGLLEPLHLDDASYPASIRRAISRLTVGQVSLPIALDEGFAIVMLESERPPRPDAPDFETVRTAMEREARLVQERYLMGRLARELVEGATVRIEDPELRRVR